MFTKRPPALAPEEYSRRADAPKRVRSTLLAPPAHRSRGLSPGDFRVNLFSPCPFLLSSGATSFPSVGQ